MTESIVLTVCRECKVHPTEFFGRGKDKRLVKCRRIAIHRLHHAGFNYAAIARIMKRDYSGILYWVHAEYREKRVGYYAKYNAERRAAQSPDCQRASGATA
jgi:hypothetical protein